MRRIIAMALVLTGLMGAAPAWAADNDPVPIGTYDGWKAYHFLDRGNKVCFMSRQPDKQEGKFKKRGEVFLFITRWSGEADKNVVSLSGGYAFKEKSDVTVVVKNKKYTLFTQGEMAWTKDSATDDALAKEIEAGATLQVKGTSSRGTDTTDTYSLKGSTDAYNAITKECADGVKK